MFKTILEGNVKISVPVERKISKKLPVFYNPIMKFNRDLSVLLLNSINRKNLQIALPLAGTGVRGIRFLKEVKGIKHVYMNDHNEKAVKLIKQNIKLNKASKVTISNTDANKFLLEGTGFDYIDIDPFGSPNPFLESSIIRLSRKGILGVTATDTSALSGSFSSACMRKYWATPLRNEQMHETGLRILIRKVQLIGAQFDKALTPIFSYSKDHYMRVFFLCEKGKTHCDKIIKKHSFVVFGDDYAGPLWTGQLWDKKLAAKMLNNNKIIKNNSFLRIINDESKISTIGFFDLHTISKKYKIHNMQKKETITNRLKKKGFKVSNTHFSGTGIRTNASVEDVVKTIK